MNSMIALDTNVWLYSHDSRDPIKQTAALQLITVVRPLALPWQVGCEFIAASRKLSPFGFSLDTAWLALAAMRAMANVVILPEANLWSDCESLLKRFSLSFWDALLAAACIRGGVNTLYSEDMAHLARIDSLTIMNPFAVP
jgi:predicted nucleic acid-binding protein